MLAVKGTAAAEALRAAGADALDGKVVIDATNPIADAPPINGVLKFFTGLDDSLMERLQTEFPKLAPRQGVQLGGQRADGQPHVSRAASRRMFICGNDAAAKQTVTRILDQFGWETEDMGGVEAARAIEPLCMLWCIPGFLRNQWTHAFKLLK